MIKQKVKSHRRAGKQIKPYKRKVRAKSKKRIISTKPVKLYAIYDEYRQFKGWSKNPPKTK